MSNSFSAAVIGGTGGVGSAIVAELCALPSVRSVYSATRSPAGKAVGKIRPIRLDLTNESSIEAAAARCAASDDLELVIVATGVLHAGRELQPEKCWEALDPRSMAQVFAVNSLGPAVVAKHFLPLLPLNRRSIFAALSARVGSISDNQLGGWYAYRASKAALNMLIKTLAIELARKRPSALCLALHPGTVNTKLSAPFQSGTSSAGRFSPERAASQLLDVMDSADLSQSGCLLSWSGEEIEP